MLLIHFFGVTFFFDASWLNLEKLIPKLILLLCSDIYGTFRQYLFESGVDGFAINSEKLVPHLLTDLIQILFLPLLYTL